MIFQRHPEIWWRSQANYSVVDHSHLYKLSYFLYSYIQLTGSVTFPTHLAQLKNPLLSGHLVDGPQRPSSFHLTLGNCQILPKLFSIVNVASSFEYQSAYHSSTAYKNAMTFPMLSIFQFQPGALGAPGYSSKHQELLFTHLSARTFQVFFSVTASQNTTLLACLYFLLALNCMKTSTQ